MRSVERLFLIAFMFLATLGWLYNRATAEELTTSNLVPGMSEFTATGGTSFGTGSGCGSGAYCTSGTSGGGGTYTSTFDVPLTEAELQQGFTLNSAISVTSHPSNSALSTCESITQSSDCRDIFKLSITLSDGNTAVESFSHQEELDFSGLRNFTFSDVVAANDYGVLTGVYELEGIDAGFPTGFFGPQFSSPSLTIDYQTALVQDEVLAAIADQIETETQDIIAETVAPEAAPVALATLVETTPALPTLTTSTIAAPTVEATPVLVVTDTPTSVSSLPPPSAAPPPPEAPAPPVIEPIAPSSQTQQAEEISAEAEIEAAVEAPTETLSEAPVEASSESPSETSTEAPAEGSSESSGETPAEAPAEISAEAPAESSEEVSAESPVAASEETSDDTSAEATSESADEPESKASSKSTKSASRRKVASTASAEPPVASVPVTPAMAAQAVVDAIAPSQKYGSAAQTTTLVAMGVIAQNKALFKGRGIPDAAVGFFTSMAVPDGPSMVDRMQNYRMLGIANGIHQRLVESQWGK